MTRHELFQDCMAMLRSDDFDTANQMMTAIIDRVLEYARQEDGDCVILQGMEGDGCQG